MEKYSLLKQTYIQGASNENSTWTRSAWTKLNNDLLAARSLKSVLFTTAVKTKAYEDHRTNLFVTT